MTKRVVSIRLPLALALAMAAMPAFAQDTKEQTTASPSGSAVEITPFVSMGSVGSSQIGAAVRFGWTRSISFEMETGYRRDEIGALSAHLSVLYELPNVKRLKPYLAVGFGLEQYGEASHMPTLGLVTQRQITFAVNAGGGLEIPVSDRWGVRSDARWFNALDTFGPEHWRVFNGVTIRPGSQ